MNCTIRHATAEDMPAVLNLIKALAVFENEPDAVAIDVNYLIQKGFGDTPAFVCFVAEVNATIEGMALVYPRFSTWKGVALHLEDLIVSEAARGQGIGTQLLDRVVQYGHDMGVKRIGWEVLDWNTPAITLYEAKGAAVLRDWNVVQLDEQGITNYLQNIT